MCDRIRKCLLKSKGIHIYQTLWKKKDSEGRIAVELLTKISSRDIYPKEKERLLNMNGDGWVGSEGYQTNVTSGSLKFADGLLEVFQSWKLKSDITEIKTQNGNAIYRIWVRGKLELQKLSEIIYKEANSEDFHIYKRVYMTQHSIKPYLVEDERKNPLWKIVDEKIVRNPVSTRISFRTNVSKSLLETLKDSEQE